MYDRFGKGRRERPIVSQDLSIYFALSPIELLEVAATRIVLGNDAENPRFVRHNGEFIGD